MNWTAFFIVIGAVVGVVAYLVLATKVAFMAGDAAKRISPTAGWLAYMVTIATLAFGLPVAVAFGLAGATP